MGFLQALMQPCAVVRAGHTQNPGALHHRVSRVIQFGVL